jgi:putative hemolysin
VILRRVFDFGDLTARQIMLPRTEIDGVDVNDSLDGIVKAIVEFKHSRLPVYEGNLDHIVGILHVRDVFTQVAGVQPALATGGGDGSRRSSGESFNARDLMRPIQAVPETLDVADLMNRMQLDGQQMVVVIDEYGGTAGIVTLEDIIEEIVGEVRDEFEPAGNNTTDIVTTSDGSIVNGLTPIDDVNEALDLNIESEADTIGGYVFEMLGRKPELGDEVSHNGHKLTIVALDGLRISTISITNKPGPSETSEAHHDEE